MQKFREWADRDGLTMVLGVCNILALASLFPRPSRKRGSHSSPSALLEPRSQGARTCTPYTVHYAYDTTALGNGTATTIVNEGGKTWFFVTWLTTPLARSCSEILAARRCHRERREGRWRGMRVPLATSDFASYVLQAQNSGAQVLGLANAGPDFSNALKAANELGITKTMKPAALLAFITDIRALGLETAQGLYLNDPLVLGPQRQDPGAFAKRFLDKVGREPTFIQAAHYSAIDDISQRGQSRRFDRPGQGHGRAAQDENQRHVHWRTGRSAPTESWSIRCTSCRSRGRRSSKYPWDYYRIVQKSRASRRLRQARGSDLRAGQEVTRRWSPPRDSDRWCPPTNGDPLVRRVLDAGTLVLLRLMGKMSYDDLVCPPLVSVCGHPARRSALRPLQNCFQLSRRRRSGLAERGLDVSYEMCGDGF